MQQRAPKVGDPREEHCQHLKERYDGLKAATERSNCESHWQEVAELVSPRKVDFVGLRTPGEKRMSKVYDSTGIHANEMLAAGLHGMATNPASKWFSLRMVGGPVMDANGERVDINEVRPIQQYLSDVEQVMWARIYQPGTNFTTALHEVYMDLGAFGTGILFVGQREDGGLLFEARPLAECVISENAEGRIDTVFRKTQYTVRQMMQLEKSDGWKISDEVKEKYAKKLFEDKIVVIHAVYPRVEREYGKKDRQNMPFASCYFEHETCQMLEEGGFPEFPYLVPRWSKYSGEIYGRSPAMTALPDLKMLQAMELTKIKMLQKAADPPLGVRDDSIMGAARTVPGGVTYFRGNPGEAMMQMPVSLQGIQALVQDQEALRQRILRTFYADIMRMVDRADMTATEVVQRTAEQMRLFGPLIGRLESEMLGPLVERIFGILTRLSLLPQPPQEAQGQEFSVEYVSPIATAQKQQAANGIVQALQMLMGLGPEVAAQVVSRRVDLDKLIDWLWDLFNNDPDLLKDEEAMEQTHQMEGAQQGLAIAGPATQAIATGAKAVKDLSAGAEKGGNLMELLSGIKDQISNDPRAQQELGALMKGKAMEPPPEMLAQG